MQAKATLDLRHRDRFGSEIEANLVSRGLSISFVSRDATRLQSEARCRVPVLVSRAATVLRSEARLSLRKSSIHKERKRVAERSTLELDGEVADAGAPHPVLTGRSEPIRIEICL